MNCKRARKVCQSGYEPISILSTQNCPYLVVEVHSRLPECAADPIVQGQGSLQDLVAQLLNLLLELFEVPL